jgi:preprotein translocase subunit SecA
LQKVVADKIAQFGRDKFYATVRQIFLQTIDTFWVEHLEVMDYMRSSVNLRAYGQRDPLVEYKKEGLRLFREMQAAINGQIATLLPHLTDGAVTREEVKLKEIHASATQAQQGGVGDAGEGGNRQARRRAAKVQQGK